MQLQDLDGREAMQRTLDQLGRDERTLHLAGVLALAQRPGAGEAGLGLGPGRGAIYALVGTSTSGRSAWPTCCTRLLDSGMGRAWSC